MNKKTNINNANLVFEELEPRLLLSADGLGVLTESSVATLQTLVHSESENMMIVQHQTEQSSTVIHHNVQSDNRSELVIIDSRAPNFQQLHNDVIKAQQQGRDINVVILDAHRDGVEQISEALSKYHKLDAVHIVSHGKDGQLQLGATQLNNQNLKQRSDDINKWQQVFTEGGDLLIYGCNLASTSNGTDLVNSLSALTATDVAASDDVTGNNILGGDWDLEYQTGDIESANAFSIDIQQNWQGTLNNDVMAASQQQVLVEEQQAQVEQETALLAESEAVLLAEEQEAETVALVAEQQAEQQTGIVEEQRQEIVFIDETVDDYQAFIDDLQANSDATTTFEIVLLDADSNGIDQINETLSAYNDVDALHIISHGDDGAVKLGNTWLNASNLDENSDSLNSWAESLDENADILIYGCNLAETETGKQFVNQLAQLTGTDVAASDDNTGHTSLSGDWELEYKQGEIETSIAISSETQNSWSNVLVNFTVDTTADTPDANLLDGLAQDGTGNTSLRAAIEQANALAGADNITIGAGTFTLSGGQLTISSDITIAGAGADQTFIDAASLSRVFDITSGTVTITGVTITGGNVVDYAGGVRVALGATLNLSDSVVSNNSGNNGGGIGNRGTLTMDQVRVTANSAGSGGGLFNQGGIVTITRSLFDGNTATGNAGGVYNAGTGASLTMTNVTISGNSAEVNAGGFRNGAESSLTNVTITGNTATTGGGGGITRAIGTFETNLTNTIIAGNSASTGADIDGAINSQGPTIR